MSKQKLTGYSNRSFNSLGQDIGTRHSDYDAIIKEIESQAQTLASGKEDRATVACKNVSEQIHLNGEQKTVPGQVADGNTTFPTNSLVPEGALSRWRQVLTTTHRWAAQVQREVISRDLARMYGHRMDHVINALTGVSRTMRSMRNSGTLSLKGMRMIGSNGW
jgi:hypothetical protein